MTREPRLPGAARWLLRLSPVARERRAEVEGDLRELFDARRAERGAVFAHRRLYRDVVSLWLQARSAPHAPGVRSPLALLRDAGADLKYAARLFARQPAILLLTIVGLSMGQGIATAAFSIMNAAVIRGEGLVESDRAPGVLRTAGQSVATSWTYDEFVRLRDGATRMQVEAVLTDAAKVRATSTEADGPSTNLAFVSGGFFAATGGRVIAGRPFERADEESVYRGGPPPVVVSYIFWTTRLNRDPDVVGRTLLIGRTEARIVGVAERRFAVPHNPLVWMPLTAYSAVYTVAPAMRAPVMSVQVFGRLLPDAGLAEAEAQLNGVAASLPAGAAGEPAPRARLDPHAGLGRVPSSELLTIAVMVFAVIGFVLVLACANVATVLIATAITREREMGVRAAIGASRGRIVRQLITESLALGTVAAAIGLLFAYWMMPTIGRLIEAPPGADLAPDLNVYLFLGIVTLVTGVGAGLAPAWHGRGADLVTPLKGVGARQSRQAPRRLRSMLVMTQAAVSVMLIVLATLFVRATAQAAAIDVGFNAEGLYAVSAGLGRSPDSGGAAIREFWARAIPELQPIPGVVGVTLAEPAPFGDATKTSITREAPPRVVHLNRTGAEYFDTVGLRLVAGRIFTRGEIAANAPVAVVSQSLARAYWPDQSPLGQALPREIPLPPSLTRGPGGAQVLASQRPVVIGIVADAIPARLYERSTLAIYEPLAAGSEIFARLLIRVAPGATGAIQQASQRLRSIDRQADIRIASVAESLRQEQSRPQMLAALTGMVGIIAIVLCVIGLYGLTASVVGQRTREMGIRAALGARPQDLLRAMMWDSLKPVALGLVVGTAAALLASRLVVAGMFFGVSPQDPVAFAGAGVILLAAAILAVLLPTRRAAAVDAAVVLRQS